MGTRGPRSTVELANLRTTVAAPRMQPPASLTPLQAETWRRTVHALPAGWFRPEHAPMLTAFVRHTTRADQIDELLATIDPLADLATFERLSRLGLAESAMINALARSMRLTQQSRMKAESAGRNTRGAAPLGIDALFDGTFEDDGNGIQ